MHDNLIAPSDCGMSSLTSLSPLHIRLCKDVAATYLQLHVDNRLIVQYNQEVNHRQTETAHHCACHANIWEGFAGLSVL